MKTIAHRLLTLLLLMVAMVPGCLCAQVLYNNDTTYFCTTSWQGGSLSHYYVREVDAFDSWAVITGLDSTFTLHVSFMNECGSVRTPMNGYFDIWEGDPATGHLLIHYTDSMLFQDFPINGDQITLHLHYNEYSLDTSFLYIRQFGLAWNSSDRSYSSPNPCNGGFSITLDSITSTGAVLHYQPANIPVTVFFDGLRYNATGGVFRLSGLGPNTHYIVKAVPTAQSLSPCCRRTVEFFTDPVYLTGCPDVLDLHSDYVRCIHDHKIGVFDRGPDNAFSQHTIHTDTSERDGFTDNLMHTVEPGMPGSVRLGNWLTLSGSESITYYLHIDTSLYSLIMLHYAAILQSTDHTPETRPRFTMQILDENDSIIDEQCGAADFVSDTNLGWNISYNALWKDWTTVGISLNSYHGQNVRLRFTTQDCSHGAHFGYAYFYADCHQPSITTERCGTVDTNTLTAPDGFNYLWYYDSPSNPVSTAQSYTYSSSEGTIHCRLSFIENPSCYITLNTYTSTFWPSAEIDTLYTVDRGCDGYEVKFLNRSTILGDDSIPQPGNPPCESALWNFGDGYVTTQYNPTHTYQHPGTYSVRLISKLAGGQCADTATFTLVAPDAWAPADQYLTCCDSILWLDSNWYSRDTVGPTVRVNYPETCDTIYTLHLTTLSSSHYTLPSDTFCYNSSYNWRGHLAPISPSLSDTLFPVLTDTLVAANGCDSLVYLPLVQLPIDPLSINVEPDCGMGFYLLTAVTSNPYWIWSSSPHDSALDGHENDLQLGVFPDTTVTYYLTSYYGDSLFCPSTTAKALSPPSFPEAQLEVNPAVLTYEKHTLYAYDHSSKYYQRKWTLVLHGTTHDTVFLPDSLPRITYTVPLEYDSVTVILAVSNAFCHDTTIQTLPIIRSALFAPNVFIPDAENNNRFTVVCNGALEAELTLYNRQGLLVFSTTDLETGWDGTHNGTPCPQGAYVWHLHYRTVDRPEQWNTQMGTVTLLR